MAWVVSRQKTAVRPSSEDYLIVRRVAVLHYAAQQGLAILGIEGQGTEGMPDYLGPFLPVRVCPAALMAVTMSSALAV